MDREREMPPTPGYVVSIFATGLGKDLECNIPIGILRPNIFWKKDCLLEVLGVS